MFTWMAIDRTNISGVLTSTFLKDTGMTRDQANTGVSLLWFGIVLLEIPSNVSIYVVYHPKTQSLMAYSLIGRSPPDRRSLLDSIPSISLGLD